MLAADDQDRTGEARIVPGRRRLREKCGKIEWRLRHARRSILNDAVEQVLIAAASPEAGAGGFGPRSGPGRTVGASPARVAANFFAVNGNSNAPGT